MYNINRGDEMQEKYSFIDEVHDYQRFVATNIQSINPNLEILKEQFVLDDNQIDILAYDKKNYQLVVLELKNVEANTDIIGQVLRYIHSLNRVNFDNIYLEKPVKTYLVVPEYSPKLFNVLQILNETANLDINLIRMNQNKNGTIIVEYIQIDDLQDNLEKQLITVEKQKDNINQLEDYRKQIDEKQFNLIKRTLQCVCNNHPEYNLFYQENKIQLMYKKKNILVIYPSKKWFDSNMHCVIYKTYRTDFFQYDGHIKDYKINKQSSKLICDDIPEVIRHL